MTETEGGYLEITGEPHFRTTKSVFVMSDWQERWHRFLTDQAHILITGRCATEAEFINQLDEAFGFKVADESDRELQIQETAAELTLDDIEAFGREIDNLHCDKPWEVYILMDFPVFVERFADRSIAEKAIDRLQQCTKFELEIRKVQHEQGI